MEELQNGPPWTGYNKHGKPYRFGHPAQAKEINEGNLYVSVDTLAAIEGCGRSRIWDLLKRCEVPRYQMPIAGKKVLVNLGEFRSRTHAPKRISK